MSSTDCGSPGYTAPEILDEKSFEYDARKADMFSLGIILYELLCGKLPYEILDDKKKQLALIKQKNIKYPNDVRISSEATKLIDKLLDVDPKKRPRAQDVLKDPWFANVKWQLF